VIAVGAVGLVDETDPVEVNVPLDEPQPAKTTKTDKAAIQARNLQNVL
jgi:hypothetical protein